MRLTRFLWLALVFVNIGCSQAQTAGGDNAPASATTVQNPAADRWITRRALYDYDATQPLDVQQRGSTDNLVARINRFTYRGARGATVPAFYVAPQTASANDKIPGIVLIHGKGGKIEEMVPLALILAARGYAVVIPEIVGHGARIEAGNPLFNGQSARLRDGLIESTQDLRRSVDFLASRPEVDSNRIGLVGLSLGAILGSLTTAVEDRIQTAVLIVGGGDWGVLFSQSQESFAKMRRSMGPFNEQDLINIADVDPVNFAGHIAPRPVLMLNGRTDNIIPPDSAKALFEALQEPKKQIWFNTGHFIPVADATRPSLEWLNDHLKNKPAVATTASMVQ